MPKQFTTVHRLVLLLSWLTMTPCESFQLVSPSILSMKSIPASRIRPQYMVGRIETENSAPDAPLKANGEITSSSADAPPATSHASAVNIDPSTDPNYHRKRRMAVAATGLLGKAAQIYSRYFSRLWKETNVEARTQSSHKKIVTSIRQLNQLLTKEEQKLAVTSVIDEKDALAVTRKMQGACQEYLQYETVASPPAPVSKNGLVEPSLSTAEVQQMSKKAKNRRSVGFGALMGLAVAGMVFSGNYVFTGIFTLMAALGQLEYYRMVMNTGVLPARRISILGSASMFITALVAPSLHEVCLPVFGLYTMIWFLTMRRTVSTIPEIATTFSGMFYLGYVPSFWVRIRQTGSQLPPPTLAPWAEPYMHAITSKIQSFIPAFVLPAIHLPITSGAIFIFWTWLCIAFSDVGAYFVGKSFGKTKLGQISPAAGEASPNKTVEGVLGGCAVSGVLGIFGAWAQRWPHFVWTGAAHGVMLALCGLIGDLTASMLKRDAGLKDFGDLLPEHGGIMDRVDSYIWTAPYSWLVLSYVLPAIRRGTFTL